MLGMNNKNRPTGFKVISTGSLTAALVHPREVYHAAVVLRAAAVIFFHNHPSGDPAPSPEDIQVTKWLYDVGTALGIRVLDHVALGNKSYFSFNDKGILG
jgi:DNA repair protein RadC